MKKPEDLILRVKQNTKGRWGYIIELGVGVDGKRKQKTSFRFDRMKDARIAGNEWIEEYHRGNGVWIAEKTNITISEYFDRFIDIYEKRKDIKPSTVKNRKSVGYRIKLEFGDMLVQNTTKNDIQNVFNRLMETDLKDNYLDTIRIVLTMLFDYSMREGLRATNPMRNMTVTRPKIHAGKQLEPEAPKYLELEELNEVLSVAKEIVDFRYYVAFFLLAHTGMRSGELMALKWDDFNPKKKTIDIYKTIFWEKDRIDDFQLLTTKTEYSQRRIDLSDDCCALLLQWKKLQAEEQKKAWRWLDDNFIFTGAVYGGHPLKHRNLSRYLLRVMQATTIEKHITPHHFRHTHISLLAEAGVTLPAIKKRVGHGDGKTTEKIYMHVTKHQIRTSMDLYYEMLEKRENIDNKIIRID